MKKKCGFTLIEVMVVVVILGILAAMLVPQLMGRPDQAKAVKARTDIIAIENALDLYKLDNGTYPTTDQGLLALIKKPSTPPIPSHWNNEGYLKHITMKNSQLLDPWGNPYQYLKPGQHGQLDIYSYGRKGQQVQYNEDELIGNWQNS